MPSPGDAIGAPGGHELQGVLPGQDEAGVGPLQEEGSLFREVEGEALIHGELAGVGPVQEEGSLFREVEGEALIHGELAGVGPHLAEIGIVGGVQGEVGGDSVRDVEAELPGGGGSEEGLGVRNTSPRR